MSRQGLLIIGAINNWGGHLHRDPFLHAVQFAPFTNSSVSKYVRAYPCGMPWSFC